MVTSMMSPPLLQSIFNEAFNLIALITQLPIIFLIFITKNILGFCVPPLY
jgi:hypothetical protein